MYSPQFTQTIAAIDAVNLQDPNHVNVQNQQVAKEWLYSKQMTECLKQYWPDANEYVALAVHAQHIKRWQIKRSEYPEGKAGYLAWRKALAAFHAETLAQIMKENGYDDDAISRCQVIIQKRQLHHNSDSQILEDVACLVFIQHYLADFATKHSSEKVIDIIKKTWRKMSPKAQQIALSLPMDNPINELITNALA
jgi:hypothetical protein